MKSTHLLKHGCPKSYTTRSSSGGSPWPYHQAPLDTENERSQRVLLLENLAGVTSYTQQCEGSNSIKIQRKTFKSYGTFTEANTPRKMYTLHKEGHILMPNLYSAYALDQIPLWTLSIDQDYPQFDPFCSLLCCPTKLPAR